MPGICAAGQRNGHERYQGSLPRRAPILGPVVFDSGPDCVPRPGWSSGSSRAASASSLGASEPFLSLRRSSPSSRSCSLTQPGDQRRGGRWLSRNMRVFKRARPRSRRSSAFTYDLQLHHVAAGGRAHHAGASRCRRPCRTGEPNAAAGSQQWVNHFVRQCRHGVFSWLANSALARRAPPIGWLLQVHAILAASPEWPVSSAQLGHVVAVMAATIV